MQDYVRIFNPGKSSEPDERLVEGAIRCLDNFGDQFNAENPKGMDDFLHFLHIIFSVNEFIEWKTRGQLPARFFDDLTAQGGKRTV